MVKKQTNFSVIATNKKGESFTYDSLEEASKATGLEVNSIKSRANKPGSGSKSRDGWTFSWADEATRRSKLAVKNRSKGIRYELQIIKELTNLGYKGLKSSRSESKNLDNAKIDIAETEDKLPFYVQCKATANTPNIEAICDACPIKDKPLVVFWKKQKNNEKQPEYVLMDKELLYKLINK